MSTELQKLIFSVSLLDQITGPAGKIKKEMNSIASQSEAAFKKIGIGAAGMLGSGFALRSMLSPAIEMDKALGEVRSLGVADSAIKQLTSTALEFSTQYGKSATDFVRSSYDIQSAIAGLSGSELSAFTKAGGMLATATKADANTITDYMGTMYGIFNKTADKMGNANWVEMLAGQTASAVQMFKTDGQKMAAAFANLGASATASGRGMAEQIAIMGTLQATMSGSESATKYKAFLAGAGKAGGDLGLKFVDDNGEMLGMVEILNTLRGKFGDVLDVAEGDALKKAFGSMEAVQLIQLLIGNTDKLSSSIGQLGSVSGMDKAVEMANAIANPWDKMSAGVNSVSIAIGTALLPVLNPLINYMVNGANAILAWTQKFPNLTRVIGTAAIAIIGITAALALFTLTLGLFKAAVVGALVIGKALALFNLLIPTLATLKAGFLALNIMMYANPIGLIVAGFVALGAAIGAVIYFWDDLKKAVMGSDFMAFIIDRINDLIKLLNYLPGIDIGSIGGNIEMPALNQSKTLSASSGGGIGKQISNNWSQESFSKSISIGTVVTSQPSATFEQEMLMMGS